MKNLNFFDKRSSWYVFRWLIVAGLATTSVMAYYDLTGRRLFGGNSDQKWSSSGPGYHK